ncbi:MAG TPA: HesA/MoeB/ThiF family protein [Bacteroidales bacterium]|nr:HesA/MoeB/ThiF family protein [Bacteroidales bacterium]
MERYIRNEKMLSPAENQRLRTFKVAVVGCGGLGGYIIEMLTRLGIAHLTVIDGDVFQTSNLNRQLLSTPDTIGLSKAREAVKRAKEINPDVSVKPVMEFLSEINAEVILPGHDLICDALDNATARRMLEGFAEKFNIPLIFGAIAGWYAQVSTIMPGDRTISKLYPEELHRGEETHLGNPSFTPALAASIQVAEAVKVLLNKEGILRNKILSVNLLTHEYQLFDI